MMVAMLGHHCRPMSFLISGTICLLLLQAIIPTDCIIRKHYIAAEDITWDYAKGGQNLVRPDQQGDADLYLKRQANRIGSEYEKTAFIEYTDETFSQVKPKPDYMGLTGPLIRAEVGDIVEILYRNKAKGTYSMHVHGVFYLKEHEGAVYMDGTSGRYKLDDIVEPGKTVKLIWKVTELNAPGERDPNCIPWVYHSHVHTPKDTNSGLIGVLVTCKKGTLNSQNERMDVTEDFPILVRIYEEGDTWHVEENLQKCMNSSQCVILNDDEDDDFVRSNTMHALNGRMYGHLNGIEACVGQNYAFYLIGMGSEDDVHSIFFHGQNLNYQHTRGDTVSVYTATFVAIETTPTTVGKWVISDMVEGMAKAGMSAFYTTKNCTDVTDPGAPAPDGFTKEFYLSAEEIDWEYGPGDRDLYTGLELTNNKSNAYSFFKKDAMHIGGVYRKAKYFRYTDDTYSTKMIRGESDKYMGILGDLIQVDAGDFVKITLKNDLPFDVSFIPHGLSVVGEENFRVKKDDKHTYNFKVPDTILDGTGEDCLNFMYTSGVNPAQEHAAGLMGPILICKAGYSLNQNKPKSLFFVVTRMDENLSPLLAQYSPLGADKDDPDFQKSNTIFTINGFAFGTLPLPEMCLGEDVTVYAMSLGSIEDTHVLAMDGNTFTAQGKNRNVQELVPGTSVPLHMKPDNLGKWLLQSLNIEALTQGAYGLYEVNTCGKPTPAPATYTEERTYFIAADEVEWDYAPSERRLLDGRDLNDFRVDGSIFVRDDEEYIGDKYKKAIFREYEEGFEEVVKRDMEERHLGLVGPTIRAEVGDKITVNFKNNAHYPFTLHPHGLKYSHDDSGKPYGGVDIGVKRGELRTYTWFVPPRSGPGPNDPDCIPFLYYSALHQEMDVHTGLIGTIITCRPGTLDKNSRRKDEHPEYFVLMTIFDENKSWYFNENLNKGAPARIGTDYKEDEDFEESNKMHSVNGYIFGNTPDFIMEYNKTIEVYMIVFGSRKDLHTIHTHGYTFMHASNGHRDDVMSMFPGMAEVVTMTTDNPGTWLLHCHVMSHVKEGMDMTFTVLQPGQKIRSESSPGNTGPIPIASSLRMIWFLCLLYLLVQYLRYH